MWFFSEHGKKTARKKRFLDTKMETYSPRTLRSKLLEQAQGTPKNESMSQATTSNKFEWKSSAFSSRKSTKSSLETTIKDTSGSSSKSKKGSKTDKRREKISKKSGGVSKAKDKMTSKKTSKLKPVEKAKWNLRKNKRESDSMDIDLKDTENELKDLGRHSDGISNESGTKVTCETCSTNEVPDNTSETLRRKGEWGKSEQRRKTGLRGRSKALLRKKRGASGETTSSGGQTFSKGFNTNLDSIPEERESEMDETRLTPRDKRLQKRARNEIETHEAFGRDTTASSLVKKKLRLSSCEERIHKIDNRVSEVDKPLSSGLADFSRQNEALDVTVSESLPKSNNESTAAIHNSNDTKQSLKDLRNDLERLGGAVGCSNADGLRNVESKVSEMGDNCCGSSPESETPARKSGDSGNENEVENVTEKEGGAEAKENGLMEGEHNLLVNY